MVRLTEHRDMTIAVGCDVKRQTKPTNKTTKTGFLETNSILYTLDPLSEDSPMQFLTT